MTRAEPCGMKPSRFSRRWRAVETRACLAFLVVCLLEHGASAQEVDDPGSAGADWAEGLAVDGFRNLQPARTDDPDLVRRGAFARWTETLTPTATYALRVAVDLNGDHLAERFLVVTPSEDPYPWNRSPGLVMVWSSPSGYRATALVRDDDFTPTLRVSRVGGESALEVCWCWFDEHNPELQECTQERFRLDRLGALHRVAPRRRAASSRGPFRDPTPSSAARRTRQRLT